MDELFHAFEASPDSLRVYNEGKLVFLSRKAGLEPILEYIGLKSGLVNVAIFDRIAGNAAALLAVKAGARSLWSPVGSRPALKTLAGYGVEAHFKEVVDAILRPGTTLMCPMEELSLGKEPDVFYILIAERGARKKGNPGC